MSGPAPPLRRNKKLLKSTNKNHPVGSGYNVVKIGSNIENLTPSNSEYEIPTLSPQYSNDSINETYSKTLISNRSKYQYKPFFHDPVDDLIPESIIGEGVNIQGELQFDRLLRIDGSFEGNLVSSGDIIIGKYGTLSGNITNIHNLYILGGVMIGNVVVDNVVARSGSIIKGNITCKSLIVEQYVTIIGRANIHSLAPEYIDHNGDIIIDAPEVEIGLPHPPKNRKNSNNEHHQRKHYHTENMEQSDETTLDREKLKEERKAKKEIEKAEVGIIITPHDKLSEISHTVFLYFAAYNPEKIDKIPKIMAKYRGREDELLNDLFEKYGPIPGSQKNNQVTEENESSSNDDNNNANMKQSNEIVVDDNNNNDQNENSIIAGSSSNIPVEGEKYPNNEDTLQHNDDTLQQNDDTLQQNDDTLQHNDDTLQQNDDTLQQNDDTLHQNDDTLQQNSDNSQQIKDAEIVDPQNSESISEQSSNNIAE